MESLLTMIDAIPMLLLVSGLVLLVSLFVAHRAKQQVRDLNKQLVMMRNDLKALTAASIGVGTRVLEIERRQRHLAEKQQELDIYESANQPYDHAIDMVKRGKGVDDIVASCGISRNEAELIQMMNRLQA